MAKPVPGVESQLDSRVETLGYDVVQVEWAGSDRRPILRVRIDAGKSRSSGDVGGITVDDCATVSRALEPWLDGLEEMPERYVLEVSSPGLERPILRDRDWTRFLGREVAIKGPRPLGGRATYLEGELVEGPRSEAGEEKVLLRLPGGEEVRMERGEISGAHLIFRWK